MTNTNITSARTNLFKLADQIIKFNDVVNITTKDGNVVMLSEDDYNALIESVYLFSIPGVKESIVDGVNESLDDCTELNWKQELL